VFKKIAKCFHINKASKLLTATDLNVKDISYSEVLECKDYMADPEKQVCFRQSGYSIRKTNASGFNKRSFGPVPFQLQQNRCSICSSDLRVIPLFPELPVELKLEI
jgi:hypothetical protein